MRLIKLVHVFLVLTICTTDALTQNLPAKLQKPVLDTSAFNNWPTLDMDPAISNDGKYVLYMIREHPRDYTKLPTLTIKAIDREWKMIVSNAGDASFTEDSRNVVCLKSNDSLCIIKLGSSSVEYIPKVSSFRLINQGKIEWLSYRSSGENKELVLRNLDNGKEQSFAGVVEYSPGKDGNVLVLKSESKKDTTIVQNVSVVNISNGSRKEIWTGAKANNLVLNDAGTQLSFVVEESIKNQAVKAIWYYKTGAGKASQLLDTRSTGIDDDMQVDGISNFSKDGNRLFIRLKEREQEPKPDAVKVDVWSYQDAKLQSQQLQELWPRTYAAVMNINGRRIIQLMLKGETPAFIGGRNSDDFVFTDDTKGNLEEANWSRTAQHNYYVVSTKSGERRQINLIVETLSPDGKYVVGRKLRGGYQSDLCSYELATGQIHNISESIPIPLETSEYSLTKSKGILFVAWMEDNVPSLLVHEKFDIWKADPSGRKAPVNVTNGYGRKNNIKFRIANERDYQGLMTMGKIVDKKVGKDEKILLHAFDLRNKNEGFYWLDLSKRGDPQRLTMGPCNYYDLGDFWDFKKARDAEVYLVRRSTASESINYFWTKDFRVFSPVSDVYPEKKYNWLTSELVSFKTIDGRTNQGIIYRPENFDPSKKYPVVIHYYEQRSEELNMFQTLEDNNGGHISIPWFASHGYVVFVPDIYYELGENGKSALNTVLGVADYLSGFPWVDAKHIGLQGHSFGGYETNFIVSHTTRFAAAISSSGIANLVSEYGGLWGSSASKQGYYENRQGRMRATLWEKPDLYIKNSPIFNLHKVTTPMLTIANKRDANVSFSQGVELFTALRRLGKRAWMLQYDNGGHGVHGKGYIDYTIRSQQFFDHYLKGAPAPKWMTRGIPASMKGVDDGLELDHEIKTPGPGLLKTEKTTKETNRN